MLQNLQDILNRYELYVLPDLFGNLLDIDLVILRNDHLLQTSAVRSQGFELQAADRQYLPLERDLTRHSHTWVHRTPGEQ